MAREAGRMLRRITGIIALAPLFLATWVVAQPAARPVEINNIDDALKFLNGGDAQGEIKQGSQRWEFVKHGGDITVRKVEQRDMNQRDGRFLLYSALASKNQVEKVHNSKEYQEFLADAKRKVAALCFSSDFVAAVAEKDGQQVYLARLGAKPRSYPLDQARKGYQELCYGSCKSNLKNLGTALEMYANDYQGHYPRKLELLAPKYLRSLPDCPGSENMTYNFEVTKEPDRYTLSCAGNNHSGLGPANYPQYTSQNGLKND